MTNRGTETTQRDGWICATCERFSYDGKNHTEDCPNHPNAAILRRIRRLEEEVEELRGTH